MIADEVTVLVVDALEMVYVEQHADERLPVALRARELFLESRLEVAAIP